jgi:sigma-B regulation protein RsbU (phosphoserine phosphatase)
VEALELSHGNEIRDFVQARLKRLLDSFSILKVGHITKFVEPISHRIGVVEALRIFSSREDINSLPVEGDFGVIGLLHKQNLLKKKTTLTGFTDPSVEKFLDQASFYVDASENCEKAMELILKRDAGRLYDDFMIYDKGRYFGIGSFADLTRNIAEIRNTDLTNARKMQEFLIGRNSADRPGLAVKKYVRMAYEIGGDYLQCMEITGNLSMLSSFDVSGKGIAAALLTSTLSSFFSTLKVCGSLSSYDPNSILSALNNVVMDQTPEEIFVAAAFVFIDREKREATFFNCGYSPVYVFFTEEESVKAKGKIISPNLWPLGIKTFVDLKSHTLPIHKNFRTFIHSDGLIDAYNEKGERYGEENLRKFLYPRCMKPVETLLADLDKEMKSFIGSAPQADDITVMIAEIS